MTCVVYAALGAFFGALVVIFVWALCGIASETDRQMEREEEARHE